MYRRRASPLHAARAGVSALYGLALVDARARLDASAAAGRRRGRRPSAPACWRAIGPDLARAARFAVPLALLLAVVNALVVRDGLTVIARFGEVPPFGQIDVTLEALAYGAPRRRCASSS